MRAAYKKREDPTRSRLYESVSGIEYLSDYTGFLLGMNPGNLKDYMEEMNGKTADGIHLVDWIEYTDEHP